LGLFNEIQGWIIYQISRIQSWSREPYKKGNQDFKV